MITSQPTPQSARQTFGRWLRAMRQERAFSQRQVPGIPAGTIAGWEAGYRSPTTHVQVAQLAAGLSLPVQAVYDALTEAGLVVATRTSRAAPSKEAQIAQLVAEERWDEARVLVQSRIRNAWNRADTAQLMRMHHWMLQIAPTANSLNSADTHPRLAGLTKMIQEHPHAWLNLLSLAFEQHQWSLGATLGTLVAQTLPSQSPLYARLCNNLAILAEARGRLDEALQWDQQYCAWAADTGDPWHAVMAHQMRLAHRQMQDATVEIAEELAVLDAWRSLGSGEPDPWVQCWAWEARTRQALARQEGEDATRCLTTYTEILTAHADVAQMEQLNAAEVTALWQAAQPEPDAVPRAIAHLDAALHTAQTQKTTEWHVLLRVRQTLARLWARQDPVQARQHWRLLAQTYWALGATDWIVRFFPDWQAVDPTAQKDVPPLFQRQERELR